MKPFIALTACLLLISLYIARAEQWQYRIMKLRPDVGVQQLNEIGADEWELVAVQGDSFIFKRPLRNRVELLEANGVDGICRAYA